MNMELSCTQAFLPLQCVAVDQRLAAYRRTIPVPSATCRDQQVITSTPFETQYIPVVVYKSLDMCFNMLILRISSLIFLTLLLALDNDVPLVIVITFLFVLPIS